MFLLDNLLYPKSSESTLTIRVLQDGIESRVERLRTQISSLKQKVTENDETLASLGEALSVTKRVNTQLAARLLAKEISDQKTLGSSADELVNNLPSTESSSDRYIEFSRIVDQCEISSWAYLCYNVALYDKIKQCDG